MSLPAPGKEPIGLSAEDISVHGGSSADDVDLRERHAISIVDVLPDLVWVEHIFLFLDIRDLSALCCCCKTLHGLLRQEEHVWRRIAQVQASNESYLGMGYTTFMRAVKDTKIEDWREAVLKSNMCLVTGREDDESDMCTLTAMGTPGASSSSNPGATVDHGNPSRDGNAATAEQNLENNTGMNADNPMRRGVSGCCPKRSPSGGSRPSSRERGVSSSLSGTVTAIGTTASAVNGTAVDNPAGTQETANTNEPGAAPSGQQPGETTSTTGQLGEGGQETRQQYDQDYINQIVGELEADDITSSGMFTAHSDSDENAGHHTACSTPGDSRRGSHQLSRQNTRERAELDGKAGENNRNASLVSSAGQSEQNQASSSSYNQASSSSAGPGSFNTKEGKREQQMGSASSSDRGQAQKQADCSTVADGSSSSARPKSSNYRSKVRKKVVPIRIREEMLQPQDATDLDGAANKIFAGHSPHVHWLERTKVVAFAGNFYRDRIGGATPLILPFIYEFDISTMPLTVVKTLDYGKDRGHWPLGEPHPQIMGAASAVWKEKVVFFGGGSPIDRSCINNNVTQFDLTGTQRWQSLWGLTGPAATQTATQSRLQGIPGESYPRPRQGLRGTVWQNQYYIFGGRELTNTEENRNRHRNNEVTDNGCRNDLWSFDLQAKRWQQHTVTGQVPAPRVWYSSCDSMNGRWLVCGGSLWDFKMPQNPAEIRQYCSLYCLHINELRWEEVTTQTIPPWVTAGNMVSTGREILYFGGTKPQEIGEAGITAYSLHERQWVNWYSEVGGNETHVFDTKNPTWSKCDFQVSCHGDLRRSHSASCFVPTTGQIIVFGGSRYFIGEYFHDVLMLDLPGCSARNQDDPNPRSSHFPGEFWGDWKGTLGRLRGMMLHGELGRDQYTNVLDQIRNIHNNEDAESDGSGSDRDPDADRDMRHDEEREA